MIEKLKLMISKMCNTDLDDLSAISKYDWFSGYCECAYECGLISEDDKIEMIAMMGSVLDI